jgi:hypothetical protein
LLIAKHARALQQEKKNFQTLMGRDHDNDIISIYNLSKLEICNLFYDDYDIHNIT